MTSLTHSGPEEAINNRLKWISSSVNEQLSKIEIQADDELFYKRHSLVLAIENAIAASNASDFDSLKINVQFLISEFSDFLATGIDLKYFQHNDVAGLENIVLLRFGEINGFMEELRVARSHNLTPPEIPAEKPAPIKVGIKNERIVPEHHQEITGRVSLESANRLREAALNSLTDLIKDLEQNTNIDPRFTRSFTRLSASLSLPLETASIEGIGFNYQLLDKINSQSKDELNPIVFEQTRHVLDTILSILNMFPEWHAYLDEVARANIGPVDIEELITSTELAAREMEERPEVVDSIIPSRLREMIEAYTLGLLDSQSLIVPILGSFSNIFGLVSSHVIEASVHVTNLTGISPLAQSTVLLAFCVGTIKNLFPIFSKFQPLKFIVGVMDWVGDRFK